MRIGSPFLFLLSVSAFGCLASCSSGGSSGGGGGQTSPTPYIYASDGSQTDSTIFSYPLSSTGSSVAPSATLNLAAGSYITGIKGNGTEIFILSRPGYDAVSDITCSVYKASNGVLTLVRSFTDELGAGVKEVSGGFAVDSSGRVYVGLDDGTIAIFGASASGTVQPSSTFNVGTNSINNLAFDATGNLFVVITGGRGILYEFAAGLASTNPIRTIQIMPFQSINDLTVDATGTVYLTGKALVNDPATFAGQIAGYAPGTSTPTVSIMSSSLIDPSAVVVTSAGALYVQGWLSTAPPSCTYSSYASVTSANAVPASLFTTPVSCGFDSARMTVQ